MNLFQFVVFIAMKEYKSDIGSIEKVVRWQERHAASQPMSLVKAPLQRSATIATSTLIGKHAYLDENILSSNYGSYPDTSPSLKGIPSKQKSFDAPISKVFNPDLNKSISASSIDSAGFKTSNSSIRNLAKVGTEQLSSFGGGEFDSGCPGSDRSSTRGLKWLENGLRIHGEAQDPRSIVQRRKSETCSIEKQRRNSLHSKVNLCLKFNFQDFIHKN